MAKDNCKMVAMCSVSLVFSTFACAVSGIFEDLVGCADVDLSMYKSLGFNIPLGNLLTWDGV